MKNYKMSILVDSDFVEGYRDYKLDLLEGKGRLDINYQVFSHILENSNYRFSNVVDKLQSYNEVEVSTTNLKGYGPIGGTDDKDDFDLLLDSFDWE